MVEERNRARLKNNLSKILIIFSVALSARLAYYLFLPDRPITMDDALSWDTAAVNVVEGRGFVDLNGFPDSVRPPIYPLFLAGIYKVFGHDYRAVKITQILLSAATTVLLFLIASRAGFESLGFWAGILAGLYAPLIVYSTIIGSETLYAFLLALLLWLLIRAEADKSPQKYGAAGVLLGVTNLCRSTLTFYPFFLMPLAWLRRKSVSEIRHLLMATVLSLLVLAPWTVRNYQAFGQFLLVNISAGQLFWLGTIEETGGRYVEGDYPGYRQFDGLTNPVDVERAHFAAGLKNIRKNPRGFVKLTALKFVRLWFEPIGYTLTAKRSKIAANVLLAANGVLIFLALYGIVRSWKRGELLTPIYALLIYFAIMHNIIAPMPRFRLPIEPYLVFFAVLGAQSLVTSLKPKRISKID